MALTQIKSGAIADDAIDSSTFADGSIDNTHLADDAVDSDQYVDGSIDNAHLADDAVDGDKLANNIDVAGTLDVTSAAVFDSTGTFSGDVSIADKIIHTGDTNTALRFPAADTITAETAGSERLRINSSGNVGIGTTSPAQLFHISSGASSTDLRIENGNADFLIQAGNAGDDGLHFYDMDNGAYRMVIDNAGQVGIGTITPSTLLDVNGVATFANTVKIGAVSNYAAAARLEVVGEAATTNDLITSIVVNAKTTGTAANGVGTQMIFLGSMTGQDNVELGRIGFHNTNVSGAYGDFVVQTRPNGTSLERLRILNDGSLRHTPYGDTSTQTYLKVDGSVSTYTFKAQRDGAVDTDFSWETQNGGTLNECVRILHDGNVGIGTALTDNFGTGHRVVQIHSGSTANSYLSLTNNTTGDQGADVGLNIIQYGNETHLNNRSNDSMIFCTNDRANMDLNENGLLSLYATGNSTNLKIRNNVTAGTTVFFTEYFYGGTSPTSGGNICYSVSTNGNVLNNNDAYGQITSDIKLKENVVDANSQWNDFKAIRFRKYNFKPGTGLQTHTQLGVIAQELELVCPNIVFESADKDSDTGEDLGTTTKGVISSLITKKGLVALQEAMARIETLEAKVAALEAA